jgi:hypothetical protein
MANTLWVGADQAYHTIHDAVAASQAGDTVNVEAGTYTNDWSQVNHDLNIVGVGGYAHLVSTTDIDNGKGELVTNGNVTVQNLEFSGASVGDQNGAGIRHESGNLTVLNSYFHDNQEGILAGDNSSVNVTIQNSSFVHNGAGDGQSHGAYVGQIASLSVDGSTFTDQNEGNQLKSRAAETTVTNSHFATGADGANYDIDLPNGGVANIHDNTFDKGQGTSNPAIIHFGGEIDNPSGNLTVTHNTFTSEISNATAVLDQTSLPVSVSDNTMSGVANVELGGDATLSGNVTDASISVSDPSLTGPATVNVTASSDPTTTDPTTTASTSDGSTSGGTIDTSTVTADASGATSDPTTTDWSPAVAASTDTSDPAGYQPTSYDGDAEGVVVLGTDGQWHADNYWYYS